MSYPRRLRSPRSGPDVTYSSSAGPFRPARPRPAGSALSFYRGVHSKRGLPMPTTARRPRHCQIPHHPTEGTPMTVAPPSHPSHRIRPIALGVVLPGVLMLAGFLRVWTWLPRIPDPAVLHWGTEGPDRTGPFTQLLLVLGVLFLVTW